MRRVSYFFSETFQNLKRNVLMSLAAISTVAISLVLLAGALILGIVVRNVTASWEAKVEISVFLRQDVTATELQSLENQIGAYPEVDNYTYVSHQQAYEEFKQEYKNQPEFYKILTPADLPASLRIKLTDAKFTQAVAARIVGAPGVDNVKFGGDIIRRLLHVNALLRTITFFMAIVLMIAAAALIANTIRLAIYSRREEIGIMKLVGATNWFIRIPFMLEGMFAALVGAAISGGVVILADQLLFTRIGEAVPFLGSVFDFTGGQVLGILLALLGVGAVVGLVGSTMAMRRFLEV
ncbi:MAG: cell division transport system permease protein [Actinomycetota bacterium]|jgi:cell division transport system permease protein|nr:cell division transport system permease protein [Actinomycetota bacterium]